MLLLKLVFVILHIITAAAWFGLALRVMGQARSVAAAEPPIAAVLAAEGARAVRLMDVFIVLTFVFALGAFFAGGGFAAYGPAYHTSLLLILVLIGIQVGLIRAGWGALRQGDLGARKRVAMGTGIGHLLWLVLLVLMYWTQLSAAVAAF